MNRKDFSKGSRCRQENGTQTMGGGASACCDSLGSVVVSTVRRQLSNPGLNTGNSRFDGFLSQQQVRESLGDNLLSSPLVSPSSRLPRASVVVVVAETSSVILLAFALSAAFFLIWAHRS